VLVGREYTRGAGVSTGLRGKKLEILKKIVVGGEVPNSGLSGLGWRGM